MILRTYLMALLILAGAGLVGLTIASFGGASVALRHEDILWSSRHPIKFIGGQLGAL